MPRSGRLRTYIKEFNESPKVEKLSFIPPFLVVIVEIILIRHAIIWHEPYVVMLTTILLILSIVEIILVSIEIHDHYKRSNIDRELTIRLDDFIIEKHSTNVKKVVEEFVNLHPEYSMHRNKIYHISCQIMETHKEELWEKTLNIRLEKIIKDNKKDNVKEIIEKFVEKFPEYKKDPGKVYHSAARIMIDSKKLRRKKTLSDFFIL